jgi:hypothetical protein
MTLSSTNQMSAEALHAMPRLRLADANNCFLIENVLSAAVSAAARRDSLPLLDVRRRIQKADVD